MNTSYRFNPKDCGINAVKGILIGIANIIPGVSGGTFALILGIYERLLDALKAINLDALSAFFKIIKMRFNRQARSDLKVLMKQLDVYFLISLAVGAVFSILTLSFLIDWLLTKHPALTLSFFIGLIIPSIAVPWRMIGEKKTLISLLWILPGIALTVMVSLSFGKISSAGDSLLWSFLTGMIAISAMILPGISGSFVMLVMGQYQNVLKKLQSIQLQLASGSFDVPSFIWLGVFAVGCIAGLLVFARLLNYLLLHQRAATLAFLIGLIIGSFWVLWPFKEYDSEIKVDHIAVEFQQKVAEKQDIKVATAPNKMPGSAQEVLFNLISLGIGFAGALGMNYLGGEEKTS